MPKEIKVDSITASGPFVTTGPVDVSGDILYNGTTWIPYTPSVALYSTPGTATVVLSSHTITGRYRRLSSAFVLFEVRGNLVFASGGGHAAVIIGLPSIHQTADFTAHGSWTSTSGSLVWTSALVGHANVGDTTITLFPVPFLYPTVIWGLNDLTPANNTIPIQASGVYGVN
jgi:hypothetical protein